MSNSATFSLDTAWNARRVFFEEDRLATGLVPSAVQQSWTRCRDIGLTAREKLAFEPVTKSGTDALGECNHAYLAAAGSQLQRLGVATRGTGYAALLTDTKGHALMVSGEVDEFGSLLKRALRVGVNLSEPAIGTSAMIAAIHERRAARVYGPEHFCLEMQSIFCAAAPVFGAWGETIGAVDISSDRAPPAFDALTLVTDTAKAIQRSLLRALPSAMRVRLYWDGGASTDGALLVLGQDGEIIAMDETARALLGLRDRPGPLGFATVFDRMFGEVADSLLQGRAAVIRRLGGLSFMVQLDEVVGAAGVPPSRTAASLPVQDKAEDFASARAIAALEASLGQGAGGDLKSLETRVMIEALRECKGNISAAARRLGISRATIHRRLRREDL